MPKQTHASDKRQKNEENCCALTEIVPRTRTRSYRAATLMAALSLASAIAVGLCLPSLAESDDAAGDSGAQRINTPSNDEGAGRHGKSPLEMAQPVSKQSDAEPADSAADRPYDNQTEAKARADQEALPHYDLAQHYMKEWDFHMAAIELQAAIMYAPWLAIFHRDYCLVALAQGDVRQSVAEFMMVVGLGEPIPLNEDERKQLKLTAAKMHYRKGIKYAKKKNWADAIAEFQWALEFAPRNSAIEHSLAFSYASSGDFEKAEQHYANGFSEDPKDGYSHADFAYLLADKGDAKDAAAQLSAAVRLEPGAAALHVDMAWMAESKGDLPTAQKEFRQAINLSPNHAGLWAHLGRVLAAEGKASEAKQAYSRALAIDPGQDDARQQLDELKTGAPAPATEDPKTTPLQPRRQS